MTGTHPHDVPDPREAAQNGTSTEPPSSGWTTVPPEEDPNPAVVDLDAGVVYARKTVGLLESVQTTSRLAAETMGDGDTEADPTTRELLAAVVLMGGSQTAATTAVIEQLGAILAELRQAREDAGRDVDTSPAPVGVDGEDFERLRRRLHRVAEEHHHDPRRQGVLSAALHDAVTAWANGR